MASDNDRAQGLEGLERRVAYLKALQSNAEALLADAELLFSHERWARALALAVLAREEAAKVILNTSPLFPDDEFSDLKSTRHEDKLTTAALLDIAFLGDLADLGAQMRQIDSSAANRQKLAALYVDERDGTVSSPTAITRDQAEREITVSKRIIDWLGRIYHGLSTEAVQYALTLAEASLPTLEAWVREHGEEDGLRMARGLVEWSQTLTPEDLERLQPGRSS